MAVIHEDTVEHYHDHESGSGVTLIVGLILAILLVWLLFSFGLPMLRTATTAPQVNVPDKVDVNINNPQGGNPAPK